VPFLAGSEEPSLTQNTDRNVLANLPIFLREHLINLKFPTMPKHRCRTPLSAHTYRLLIFKEPTYFSEVFKPQPLFLKRRVRKQQRSGIMR
jgi:hypothetical protein